MEIGDIVVFMFAQTALSVLWAYRLKPGKVLGNNDAYANKAIARKLVMCAPERKFPPPHVCMEGGVGNHPTEMMTSDSDRTLTKMKKNKKADFSGFKPT